MGGNASKHKKADGEAKKTPNPPKKHQAPRPTDRQVTHHTEAHLCRTQSFRESLSPPIQRFKRAGTSRPHRKKENVTQQNFKQTNISRKKGDAPMVAAIDFGTTYTAFGFSTKQNPQHIFGYHWHGTAIPVLAKIPTVVLLKPNKELHSFGAEAKAQYIQLLEKNEHHNWYYFDRFKMKLFAREMPLVKDVEIEDILGKPMAAMDVFAVAIRYIREKLLVDLDKAMNKQMQGDTDIHWVLTVPAIWDDLSKQFMREAAQQAGIPNDMLTLALEPEAASLCCKKDLQLGEEDHFCRYMLVDLGGGTADITCHEVDKNGRLIELHQPTGGAFGGTTVDNAFLDVLCRLFGADIIAAFKKTHLLQYWELLSDFETKKKYFDGSGEVSMIFPTVILELYNKHVGESLEQSLKQSSIAENVKFKLGKMFMTETLMKDIFNTSVAKIKDAVFELLEKVQTIDTIILVGGFSECPYVQKVMKEHFGNLILLPMEPSLCVLRGAGIYGHDPRAISSRKCKYTYGIARMVRFDPKAHPERKKVRMGHFTFCDDAFCKHIEIGTDVSLRRPEEATVHEYYPSFADQRHAVLEVYSSTEKEPKFVDDESCNFVGVIKVDINARGDIWTKLTVRLIFGGTELIVEVTDVKNRTITKGSVDFLG